MKSEEIESEKTMERTLIEAVQMYPCLFDKNKREYRNRTLKDEAWASVAEETGESVERCQSRWRSLRDRYVRELMLKAKAGGTSPGTRWVYMDAMNFLQDHVAPYSRTTLKRESMSSLERKSTETDPLEDSSSTCPISTYVSTFHDETTEFSPVIETPKPLSQLKRRKVQGNDAHQQFDNLCSALNNLIESKTKETEKSRNADFYKVLDSYLLKHTEEDQDRLKIQILDLVYQNHKPNSINFLINHNEN